MYTYYLRVENIESEEKVRTSEAERYPEVQCHPEPSAQRHSEVGSQGHPGVNAGADLHPGVGGTGGKDIQEDKVC